MLPAPAWSPDEYTATHGVMQLLLVVNQNPATGTGPWPLYIAAKRLFGQVPKIMVQYQTLFQLNLFGDYPNKQDIAPLAVFIGVFAVISILHFLVFAINVSRDHYFWLLFGFGFCALMKVVGFGTRIGWQNNLGITPTGITSAVFLVIPSILLMSFNLILAQRIFTWRHPVGGSRRLFWNLMLTLYAVVTGVIAMTILALAIPYQHFLTQATFTAYQKTVQASLILILLYTFAAVSLIGLAYFVKPTKADKELYTYQPWWIESFRPFYFVRKGAVREAEESFMKRGHNQRHAIRVIAATFHNNNMVEGLSNSRGDLKHNWSICIVFATTILVFVGMLLRCIVTFQGRYQKDALPVGSKIALYLTWGMLETFANVIYLVGRVDLRFYRPDRLPLRVRQIITAQQSLANSRAVSVSSFEDDLENHTKLVYDNRGSFEFGRNEDEYGEKEDYSSGDDYREDYPRHKQTELGITGLPYASLSDLESIDDNKDDGYHHTLRPPSIHYSREGNQEGHPYRQKEPSPSRVRPRRSDEFEF